MSLLGRNKHRGSRSVFDQRGSTQHGRLVTFAPKSRPGLKSHRNQVSSSG